MQNYQLSQKVLLALRLNGSGIQSVKSALRGSGFDKKVLRPTAKGDVKDMNPRLNTLFRLCRIAKVYPSDMCFVDDENPAMVILPLLDGRRKAPKDFRIEDSDITEALSMVLDEKRCIEVISRSTYRNYTGKCKSSTIPTFYVLERILIHQGTGMREFLILVEKIAMEHRKEGK